MELIAVKCLVNYGANGNIFQLPLFTVYTTKPLRSLTNLLQDEDKTISGKIVLNVNSAKGINLSSVRIELVGETSMRYLPIKTLSILIEVTYPKNNKTHEFVCFFDELLSEAVVRGQLSCPFSFSTRKFEHKYETYSGICVKTRYRIPHLVHILTASKILPRAIVESSSMSTIINDMEIAFQTPINRELTLNPLRMQLRIADYLIVGLELPRTDFYMDECIVGKIDVEKIKLNIGKIQLGLMRREIINPSEGNIINNWNRFNMG